MMHASLKKWELYGAIFTMIFGTLLHFFYDWSNQNPIIALFAPKNESTWEHLKLLFFPVLFFSIIQYIVVGKTYRGYITGKLVGLCIGMLSIIVIFYLYVAVVGHSVLWIDISLFFFGVLLTYWTSCRISYALTSYGQISKYTDLVSLFLICVILFFFFRFTVKTPDFFLFRS